MPIETILMIIALIAAILVLAIGLVLRHYTAIRKRDLSARIRTPRRMSNGAIVQLLCERLDDFEVVTKARRSLESVRFHRL